MGQTIQWNPEDRLVVILWMAAIASAGIPSSSTSFDCCCSVSCCIAMLSEFMTFENQVQIIQREIAVMLPKTNDSAADPSPNCNRELKPTIAED